MQFDSTLYMKRFEKHIMVQNYLNQALEDNAVLEELYDSMPEIGIDIKSGNPDLQFSGMKKICFLFENLVDPPIAFVIENNIVPHMLNIMTNDDQGHVFMHDAARLLRVILNSSPNQAKEIMDAGGVASYATLLTAQQDVLKYEAVVGVECAASLSSAYRNELLHLGVVKSLATILEQHLELPLLQLNCFPYYILNKGASALRWLCYGDPLPTPNELEIAVPVLKRLINVDTGHWLAIRDACIALRFLSRRSVERMNIILDAQFCERLVFLLDPITPTAIIDPVLTFLGNIFVSSDPNAQLLVNSGMLPRLHELLNGDDFLRPFWKKSCDVISVFLHGGRQRLQMVLDADLILPLLEITQDQWAPVETKLAAVCAIANAARIGSFPQIVIMVNQGCLDAICWRLNSVSERTRHLCVEGLFNVLRMGSTNMVGGVNPFTALVGALGGFHRLMDIRNDARAGERARMILMRYNQQPTYLLSNLKAVTALSFKK